MKSVINGVVAMLLVATSALAFAHHGRLQEHLVSARVLSAGRYGADAEGFVRASAHVAASRIAAPIAQGDRIQLTPGERFGFCFEVDGFLEDGEVDLQKIVTHPAIEIDGRRVDGYADTIEVAVAGGKARGCIGHTLAADEWIAGVWTIGLGFGETTLLERRFVVE